MLHIAKKFQENSFPSSWWSSVLQKSSWTFALRSSWCFERSGSLFLMSSHFRDRDRRRVTLSISGLRRRRRLIPEIVSGHRRPVAMIKREICFLDAFHAPQHQIHPGKRDSTIPDFVTCHRRHVTPKARATKWPGDSVGRARRRESE